MIAVQTTTVIQTSMTQKTNPAPERLSIIHPSSFLCFTTCTCAVFKIVLKIDSEVFCSIMNRVCKTNIWKKSSVKLNCSFRIKNKTTILIVAKIMFSSFSIWVCSSLFRTVFPFALQLLSWPDPASFCQLWVSIQEPFHSVHKEVLLFHCVF